MYSVVFEAKAKLDKMTGKHRSVYSIHDNILTVKIIAAKGHYGDR